MNHNQKYQSKFFRLRKSLDNRRKCRQEKMYDKEGEVLKLSGYLVKSWEKRWFRLDGPLLFYYVDKQEALYNPGNHRQVFGTFFFFKYVKIWREIK